LNVTSAPSLRTAQRSTAPPKASSQGSSRIFVWTGRLGMLGRRTQDRDVRDRVGEVLGREGTLMDLLVGEAGVERGDDRRPRPRS
jgi:hypothetical protein